MLKEFEIKLSDNIHCLGPLGFRESLYLRQDAIAVLTDSGGLQEETTALGGSCLTLWENTERPVTIELGTNILGGNQPAGIMQAFKQLSESFGVGAAGRRECKVPKWYGRAAERIGIFCWRRGSGMGSRGNAGMGSGMTYGYFLKCGTFLSTPAAGTERGVGLV